MRDYVPPRLWMSNVNYGVSSLYHNHMLFVINTLSFHFQHGTPAAISHIKSLLNIESLCTWQQNCKISRISLCLNRRNDANSVSQVSKHQPKACQFGLSPCDPGIGLVSLWKQRSGGGRGGGGGGGKRMPVAQNGALVSSHSYQLTVTPLWLSCVCPYILYIDQVKDTCDCGLSHSQVSSLLHGKTNTLVSHFDCLV